MDFLASAIAGATRGDRSDTRATTPAPDDVGNAAMPKAQSAQQA
jgi:hypothetical protein